MPPRMPDDIVVAMPRDITAMNTVQQEDYYRTASSFDLTDDILNITCQWCGSTVSAEYWCRYKNGAWTHRVNHTHMACITWNEAPFPPEIVGYNTLICKLAINNSVPIKRYREPWKVRLLRWLVGAETLESRVKRYLLGRKIKST